MPNHFALTRKSNPSAGYVGLNTIDEELCAHFSVPVDDTQYYNFWYGIIGLGLACGHTFQQIRENITKHAYKDPVSNEMDDLETRLIEITEYLEEHFTSSAWATVGR